MIQVPPASLPPPAARALDDYQAAVNALPSYAERVAAAKERFGADEDPLSFMRLDLQGTFLFRELHPPGSKEHEMANYTIEVLNLNGLQGRDYLPEARSNAYVAYQGVLHRYILEKAAGCPPEILGRKRAVLSRFSHPTVWAEMKRQQGKIAELRALFAKAPEALDW